MARKAKPRRRGDAALFFLLLQLVDELAAVGFLQCIGEVVWGPFPGSWPTGWPVQVGIVFNGPAGALTNDIVPLGGQAQFTGPLSINEGDQQLAFG